MGLFQRRVGVGAWAGGMGGLFFKWGCFVGGGVLGVRREKWAVSFLNGVGSKGGGVWGLDGQHGRWSYVNGVVS